MNLWNVVSLLTWGTNSNLAMVALRASRSLLWNRSRLPSTWNWMCLKPFSEGKKNTNENNVNMWLIQLWICVLQMYYYVINESFNMWSAKEWLCLKKWQCMMCKSVKTWIKECQIDKDSMACSYRLIKLFVCDWQQVNNKKLGYVTSVVVVSMLFMQNWSTERDVGKETVANRHAHVKAISQANTMGV